MIRYYLKVLDTMGKNTFKRRCLDLLVFAQRTSFPEILGQVLREIAGQKIDPNLNKNRKVLGEIQRLKVYSNNIINSKPACGGALY